MSVTALARKPVIRNVNGSEILGELQASERQDEKRLVSVYIPDAGAHIMYESVNNKMRWQGAWAPISKQDAIECAREHAYNNGVAAQDNLFYTPQGFDRGKSGYVWGDVDAGSDCLDIDALGKYQDRRLVQEQDVGFAKDRLGQQHSKLVAVIQVLDQRAMAGDRNTQSAQQLACLRLSLPAVQLAELDLEFGSAHAVRLIEIRLGIQGVLLLHDLI